MASSNINKIVQSNFNLKPLVLSKNTNEIVNTCIQKIYNKMPNNFRRGLKTPKVASPRVENLGPIRSYKNEERLKPVHMTITAQHLPVKKSSKSNTMRLKESNLMKSIKASSRNNMEISNKIAGVYLTSSNKKLLKSPNYKIYKARQFGSSANSSRSSIFRRNDERRRQRMHYQPQVNYLAHSFNNSQFEGTYAKYLIPLRNQYVETNLGSLSHAKRISEDIQNDLMKIDTYTLGRISMANIKNPINAPEPNDRLNMWKHPPSLSMYSKPEPSKYIPKNTKWANTESRRITRLSPENRDTSGVIARRPSQHVKLATPLNQQYNSKHDSDIAEMQEKHRRNRMKKLGLLEESPAPTEAEEEEMSAPAEDHKQLDRNNVSCEFKMKWTPNIESHMEAKALVDNKNPIRNYSSKFQSRLAAPTITQTIRYSEDKPNNNSVSKIQTNEPTGIRLSKNEATGKPSSLSNEEDSDPSSKPTSYAYTSTGPAAAARAQLTNNINYSNHRYNRDDFFSPRKY